MSIEMAASATRQFPRAGSVLDSPNCPDLATVGVGRGHGGDTVGIRYPGKGYLVSCFETVAQLSFNVNQQLHH